MFLFEIYFFSDFGDTKKSNRWWVGLLFVLVLGDGLNRHLVHSLGEVDNLQPLRRQLLQERRLLNSLPHHKNKQKTKQNKNARRQQSICIFIYFPLLTVQVQGCDHGTCISSLSAIGQRVRTTDLGCADYLGRLLKLVIILNGY